MSFCGFNFKVHLNWTHLESAHKKWACTYSLSNECRLCETSTHALIHTHTHTRAPNQHLSRMYVNMCRQPHKSTASRWTESRNTRENFHDASRHPSLFLPPLFLRWARRGVLLTGTVVCIQQMWDETHPRRDGLILCAFVKAVFFPLFLLPRSVATAGRRRVSQGHDAGSVLLTGPASGRWTHTHSHMLYFIRTRTHTVIQSKMIVT